MRSDFKSLASSKMNFWSDFKFIKEFWDVIKPDVLHFLDEFYAEGKLCFFLNTDP